MHRTERVDRRAAWRHLRPVVRSYAGTYAVGVTLTVVSAGVAALLPWFLRRALDLMHQPAPDGAVWRIAGVMLAVSVGNGALRYLMREVMNGVSRRIETDLRRTAFASLTRHDATWYTAWRTGDLMARLTNDLSAVRMACGPAVMYLVNTIAGGCFAIVMMARIDGRLTAAALLPLLAIPAMEIVLGRRIHARFEAVQEEFSALTTRAQENLAGVRVVRAFRQERAELERFDALSQRYADGNVRLAVLNGILNPGFGLLAGFATAITLGYGGTLLLRGTLTVGAFVAFGIYLAMLTWPLIALGWTTNLFQRGAASMLRLAEVLEPSPRVLSEPSRSDVRSEARSDVKSEAQSDRCAAPPVVLSEPSRS
ncbi:MAG: ABC transporter transmembrane domain-containing protein, partial [Gemmatimonadaceae bacterium]|nr:ABC transporter transmembrane domain-containing protein [Gemmatimonadaceae bacterium]